MRNVSRVSILTEVLTETLYALRTFGKSKNEGLVLWLGQIEGYQARITHSLVPPQKSIQSEDGVGYIVTEKTLLEISRFLNQKKLKLIAQVHSHPGRAYHSSADDRYAIVTKEGGFSLVVPNFGFGRPDLATWAVYRLSGPNWIQLDHNQVDKMFTIFNPQERSGQGGNFSVIV
ncbi:MAG: hypothetical protein M1398_03995 [Deltaproteobacteria bacterium]|nr:hypothetical protein [Deltaproteobacteria bacterium]